MRVAVILACFAFTGCRQPTPAVFDPSNVDSTGAWMVAKFNEARRDNGNHLRLQKPTSARKSHGECKCMNCFRIAWS